jgi:hypothetical protein
MNRSQTHKAISGWQTHIGLVLVLSSIIFAGQGAAPARADDGPRIVKTRLYVKLWQNHSYWPPATMQEQYDTTSWLPSVRFRVIGPVPGGSQFSVAVTKPDGSPWVSLDCPTEEIGAGRWLDVETPREPPGGTFVAAQPEQHASDRALLQLVRAGEIRQQQALGRFEHLFAVGHRVGESEGLQQRVEGGATARVGEVQKLVYQGRHVLGVERVEGAGRLGRRAEAERVARALDQVAERRKLIRLIGRIRQVEACGRLRDGVGERVLEPCG